MKDKSGIVREQRLVGYDDAVNFIPYYTSDVWSMEEDYFIFYSQRNGVISLNRYFPGQEKYELILEMGSWASSFTSQKDPFSELVCSGHVRNTETVLLPFENRICHVSIPGKSMRFSNARFPDDTQLAGPFHVSHDGKYLTGVNYGRSPSKIERTSIFVYDIAGEKIILLKEFDFWANHPQFFRNTDLMLFCHEGATEGISDRMHIFEWKRGAHYPFYPQKHNDKGELVECIGHEMPAGDKVITVRYPVSKMPDCGIVLADPRTKSGELIDHDDYLHVASNAAGNIFVMDTCWWGNTTRKTEDQSDIFLYDKRSKKKYFLAGVCCSMKNQAYHVHPRLNMAGDIVLATAKESVGSPNAKILMLKLDLG